MVFRHGDRTPLTLLNDDESRFWATQLPPHQDIAAAAELNPVAEETARPSASVSATTSFESFNIVQAGWNDSLKHQWRGHGVSGMLTVKGRQQMQVRPWT